MTKGNLRRDFSRGFYTTTLFDQAVTHARYVRHHILGHGAKAAVVFTFEVNRDRIGSLTSLAFVQAIKDYWDFVDWCRAGTGGHNSSGYYDVVYGPVSENYRARAIHEGFDQISFHNASAVGVLGPPHGRVVG